MDKSQYKYFWIGGALIIALFVILFSLGVLQNAVSPTGNVYCNDYEIYCCQSVRTPSSGFSSFTLSATSAYQCPLSATNCDISSYSPSDATIFTSATLPVVSQKVENLWAKIYSAPDMTVRKSPSVPFSLNKGNYLWGYTFLFGDSGVQISYAVNGQRLAFTGKGTDAVAGIPVQGSSNCVWDSSLGKPLDTDSKNALSYGYVVPVNDCVLSDSQKQFVCGNINDECSSDSDCNGYPINGNQLCSENTLRTYKCLSTQLPSGVKLVDGKYVGEPTTGGQDPNKYSGTGKKCMVDVTLNKQVSCCPSSSVCGSSRICDSKTFTCVDAQKVECTQNSDCRNTPQCDYSALTFNTPYCGAGKCDYKKSNVECCVDSNCNIIDFCDTSDHTCKAKATPDVLCPYECCLAGKGYTVRSCPTGRYCTNTGSCSVTPVCTSDAQCDPTKYCKDGECIARDLKCTALLGGIVPSNAGTVKDCNFGCQLTKTVTFGIVDNTKSTSTCLYDWTAIIIFGIVLIIGLIIFAVAKGGKKGKGKNVSNSTIKWIIVVIVVGLAFFLLWKYIIWVLIILIVLALLDTFLFGGIIKKVIFRG